MSKHIKTEEPSPGVVRIVLNRPDVANAQNNELLYELNAALDRAARDNHVKVIILAGQGKHFSSGHDLSSMDQSLDGIDPVHPTAGIGMPGAEGQMAFEEEAYFGLCWRWRNIQKPTIAEVQGKVIAGGLMLMWVCDLIVASEDATFQDPVVAFGANGVEYFAHPWELGVRKAKEFLFTGRALTAESAMALGMVNRVVPRKNLSEATLELASEIARQPAMGLRLAKLSVNDAQDAQGFLSGLRSAMAWQQLSHSHNMQLHDDIGHPDGYQTVRDIANLPPL